MLRHLHNQEVPLCPPLTLCDPTATPPDGHPELRHISHPGHPLPFKLTSQAQCILTKCPMPSNMTPPCTARLISQSIRPRSLTHHRAQHQRSSPSPIPQIHDKLAHIDLPTGPLSHRRPPLLGRSATADPSLHEDRSRLPAVRLQS